MKTILLLATLLLSALSAHADKPAINQTLWGGVAIKGYDPVAYFTEQQPVKGSRDFEFVWNGATWRFASAENLQKFRETPQSFAPQYGGYCAWAVAQGDTANIDPTQWTIVDGKLYLNYNRRINERWKQDIPGNIEKANANWPTVLE